MKTTVKSIVEDILQKSESARNSDRALLAWFMQEHGLVLTQDQMDTLFNMPSLETARRERQKFQEAGMYLPTEKVAQARSTASQVIQQRIPTTKPENIGKLFDDASYKTRNFG